MPEIKSKQNKRLFVLLTIILNTVLFLFLGQILFPHVTTILLTTLWYVLFIMVLIFMSLGAFVLLGMREEVGHILDSLVEGTLSIFDFFQLAKKLFEQFLMELREFVVFIAPFVAYFLVTVLYFVLLITYKYVGQYYDVTLMTILLTILLVSVVALFNLPSQVKETTSKHLQRFLDRFKEAFSDGTEIAIFVFFLTMDSNKLFFLSDALNQPLNATLFGYDLMQTSFTRHGTSFTLTLIIIAITSEIIKAGIRIVTVALDYYDTSKAHEDLLVQNRINQIKASIRQSFHEAKDDTLKLIAFTTFLLFVFLFFPRLKVLSMAVASLTAFAFDMIIPERLHTKRGTDLISRVIEKVFRL